jgi:hypothetical protein
LPVYVKLSKDTIWGVRKSCICSLVGIAEESTQKIKKYELTDCMKLFLKDHSRWCKLGACEILGKFI